MEITEELKAKAMACETAEELLALADENGIELSAEEAELVLQEITELREGELSDEELDGVAGGAKGCERNAHKVVYFNSEAEVEFLYWPGNIVQAFIGAFQGNETATVRITDTRKKDTGSGRWIDEYTYDRISGAPTHWGGGWQPRSRFEK